MTERTVLLVYGSKYGQSEKIARRIGDHLQGRGHTVTLLNIRGAARELGEDGYDAILVAAPVYTGRHLKTAERWVRDHRAGLESRLSAFVSVCGAASGSSEEDRQEAARYVADFSERTGWRPDQTAIVAGAVSYTKYGLLIRWIMRRIQKTKGSDVDTSRDYEYTDWSAVEGFAAAFADRLERSVRGGRPRLE